MSRKSTVLGEVAETALFAMERVRIGAMAIAVILMVKIAGLHLFPTPAPMATPAAVAAIR